MTLNLKNPLCFFDLEATGISIANDRIVEIAMIKLMPNGDELRKVYKVNPTIPIPPDSTAIHGISDADVKDKPTFKEIAKECAKFLEGADLSGFNILKFDVPMLVEEFLRADVEFDYKRKKIIDAQRIFHMMEKRTLGAAYKFYVNKEMQNAHSAEVDTEATIEVLKAQVAKYDGQEVTDGLGKKIGMILNDMETLNQLSISQQVDLAGRMVYNQKGVEVFNFGKHRNKPVTEILKQEPSYYDWIMKGDFPLDTKRRLTEIKLKSFKM